MSTIYLNNVTKKIKNHTILQDVNLKLTEGNIYGFIGENGAGKSMLFRMIAGLVKPTSGEIQLDDRSIGIVIEHASMYPSHTGLQNLMLLAKINNKVGIDQVREAIKAVGLDPDDKRKIGKYSLGMKQRINIAQAIMEKPNYILLDEPTNALDEEGVILVRNLIRQEAERGAVVLLASHNKEDIVQLCTKTYRISAGHVTEENSV